MATFLGQALEKCLYLLMASNIWLKTTDLEENPEPSCYESVAKGAFLRAVTAAFHAFI